jgi:pimeloyl-ACP methyl ester carboxylesterase
MQVDPPVTPADESPDPIVLPQGPPPQFVEAGHEGRLIGELRARARLRNPTVVLAHSATEFIKAARARTPAEKQTATDLGRAIADLAVTGRQTYGQFKNGIRLLALEGAIRDRLAAQPIPSPPTNPEIQEAMNHALDRAYEVAWALRGPVTQQAELRAGLDWIAVSAEDDTPHRPVNMAAPRAAGRAFEQYEVQVRTRTPAVGGEIAVSTRYFVACADDLPTATVPRQRRKAPDDGVPFIPDYYNVLLFVHGHSSGAEEALDLIPHLLEEGRRQNRRYAVISFDLPNNGYSETFDHTRIAAAEATSFPTLTTRNAPIATPILDFIEAFVVAFVDALEDEMIRHGTPRIKHRIAAVMGGSLGGNVGLRLGRRNPMPEWVNHAIVSWSPASVWKAKVRDDPGLVASRDTFVEFQQPEVAESRRRYFFRTYEEIRSIGLITITRPQPEYWYRATFPNKALCIQSSRLARREIYNPFYRQWHWRVACEQLIYSHFENEVYGDRSTPVRYTLNTVRTLLAAGAEDDHDWVRIYDGTTKLGESMAAPGRLLRILHTGHSIHIERPAYFASAIVKFLKERNEPESSSCALAAAFGLLLE